jgi:hypothetical protein
MGAPQYVLLDGDQVGRRLDDLLLRDALPRLYFLVQDLNNAVLVLARVFKKVGGLVYLAGGDTVLGSVDNIRPLFDEMHAIRHLLPCTFSAGVGGNVRDALIALKLAKARGAGAAVRVRRVRDELLVSHWEEPDGWRNERPTTRPLVRREKVHRRRRPRGLRLESRFNSRGRRGSPLPSG